MKTKPSTSPNTGSVLLVTLVITGILGLALASYLTMIGTQNRSVARSQNWNTSVPIAEAGIEEALVHLNKNCVQNDLAPQPINWTADGWTPVANGYQKTNALGQNYYITTIVTAAPHSQSRPAILSAGYVPALLAHKKSDVLFATVGTANQQTQQQQPSFVGRKVRVTTAKDGLMIGAMVAKDSIDFNGNGVSTDSYDSEDPAYSTFGRYDPTKRKDHGDVAVNYGLINSLNVGNANIRGSIAVGPGGSIAIGPNGTVGDHAWHASNQGIQPGHSRDDMNVSFPDVQIPFTGGYSVPGPRTVTNEVVTTVSTTNTTSGYPSGSGTVYTNTTITTTASYPSSGTYIGSVVTNTVYTNTVAYPSSGTYTGIIATNTVSATSSNRPSAGTYVGSITTNTTTITTTSYPSSPYGPVSTNTAWTTDDDYPESGTYIGAVTTNRRGNGSIRNYSFNRITGYTSQRISTYSYEQMSGYNYNKITGYTVARIVSYSLVQYSYLTNFTAVNYDYVLDAADNTKYQIASLSGRVLVIGGDVKLYVTSSLSADQVEIATGARLKLYMGGSSFAVSGTKFVNRSGDPDRLWYFGLPSNTSITLNGNGGFCGVIYAPQAAFKLNGGGSNTEDFIGASLTKSVQMNGHFNFHYDEALARKGSSRGYTIKSWDEVPLHQVQ